MSWKLRMLSLALIAGGWAAAPANAQSPAPWEKIKIGDVVQSLKIGGDLRLRDEYFDRRSAGATNRHRQRFRLRVVTDVQLPHDLLLGLRWGSGTGEQVSTNQSFDNLSSQKAVWIDLAYLRWTPKLSENGSLQLAAGRMPNHLWRTYSSDLVWDDDFNPEGFGQGIEWLLPEAGLTVFAKALQMAADEDSNTAKEQWLFSQQAGLETRLPLQSRLRLALAYHKWSDENRSSFSQAAANQGNRRTGTVLTNRFGVGEITGELTSWAGNLPLSAQFTLARNLRALDDLAGPRARDGYQYGLILGKAKARKSWELAWFLKYAQTDVAVADVSDSDFGDGGTNRRGHIFWAAYNPEAWLQLKAKYFTTKVIDTQFPPGANDVNRLQMDMSVKF